MSFFRCITVILIALFSTSSQATTGINSVGYLWVFGLVLLGLLGLLGLTVLLIRFLKRVRQDIKKHEHKQNE